MDKPQADPARVQSEEGSQASGSATPDPSLPSSLILPRHGGEPPATACINCGEANDGGYMSGLEDSVNEGNVGPFCSECWGYLEETFTHARADTGARQTSPVEQQIAALRQAINPNADATWTAEMFAALAQAHRQDSELVDAQEAGARQTSPDTDAIGAYAIEAVRQRFGPASARVFASHLRR